MRDSEEDELLDELVRAWVEVYRKSATTRVPPLACCCDSSAMTDQWTPRPLPICSRAALGGNSPSEAYIGRYDDSTALA
jgi:hypothetical protein